MIKPIDCALALHEIAASVRQLAYMKQHSKALLDMHNVTLEITYHRAPVGRMAKGQTYMLHRKEQPTPAVLERLREQQIWKQWSFERVTQDAQPFVGNVCHFIQTYQMLLQSRRQEKGWGKVDLVGATGDALPVVIELKQEKARDTPLRMLVEGLAYACAVRKAWNEGRLRAEWASAMKQHGFTQEVPRTLATVPVILLAPSDFWKRAIGLPGKRTNGKVRDDAWPIFMGLVHKCKDHGFPIHFVQFGIERAGNLSSCTISNVSLISLPHDQGCG